MAEWKYKLKFGQALRNALATEDPDKVIDALVACFTEIHKAMPEYLDDSDLEDFLTELADYRDTLQNYEDYDMSYDDAVDNVDYMLDKLYDICDDLRIWIPL